MTKSELVRELAQVLNMPAKRAKEIVDIIFEALNNALVNGERVEIRGFGSFSVKQFGPRTTRNPKTGEIMQIGVRRSVAFRPGKDLKDRVNNQD